MLLEIEGYGAVRRRGPRRVLLRLQTYSILRGGVFSRVLRAAHSSFWGHGEIKARAPTNLKAGTLPATLLERALSQMFIFIYFIDRATTGYGVEHLFFPR